MYEPSRSCAFPEGQFATASLTDNLVHLHVLVWNSFQKVNTYDEQSEPENPIFASSFPETPFHTPSLLGGCAG